MWMNSFCPLSHVYYVRYYARPLPPSKELMDEDGVHYTKAGSEVLAQSVVKALRATNRRWS